MKVFVIDIAKCNGCYGCQIACNDEHAGNDWMPYARPQPDTGQFWCKVTEHTRGTIPQVKVAFVPELCMHCTDAPCIKVCPNKAISQRNDGLVIIDPKKCTACMICFKNCPTEAIHGSKGIVHWIEQEKCIKCNTCFEVCPPRFSAVRRISGEPLPPPPTPGTKAIREKKR